MVTRKDPVLRNGIFACLKELSLSASKPRQFLLFRRHSDDHREEESYAESKGAAAKILHFASLVQNDDTWGISARYKGKRRAKVIVI